METQDEDVVRDLTPDVQAEAEAVITWLADIARLRAEVERLREALEPFEELSCEGNWDQPDDTKVIVHAGRATCYWLTLADLRRARKALEGE